LEALELRLVRDSIAERMPIHVDSDLLENLSLLGDHDLSSQLGHALLELSLLRTQRRNSRFRLLTRLCRRLLDTLNGVAALGVDLCLKLG
jgi:hypothetical protein